MNIGARLAGRYRIERALASDARVYLARDEQLGKHVAVKVFPRVDGDLFRREAAIACRVQHPNLVRILDVGLLGDEGWLVLEYVAGMGIRTGLQGFGAMGVRRALHVAEQVFAALDALHRGGFAHGDVNPGNLQIDDTQVRLFDYGLGRFADTFARGDGPYPGTMEYMHPSLYAGGLPTPATDVFAAWVTTYELLVRTRPYTVGELARGGLTPPVSVQDPALDALLWVGLEGRLDARASWLSLRRFRMGKPDVQWTPPAVSVPPRILGRLRARVAAGRSLALIGPAPAGRAAPERLHRAHVGTGTVLWVRSDWAISEPL